MRTQTASPTNFAYVCNTVEKLAILLLEYARSHFDQGRFRSGKAPVTLARISDLPVVRKPAPLRTDDPDVLDH